MLKSDKTKKEFTMRTLASIRRIRSIAPIEGADFVVKAQIDGWSCVTRKDEFNVNDLAVYFEIDAFLPATDVRYAFLEKNFITFNEKRGARIRTEKRRGSIAQGLLLPLSEFSEIGNPVEGLDVTALLGIEKWEPHVPPELAGEVVGVMPGWIRKTDEERIQNLVGVIATEIAGKTFEQTVKLDGTSMTVFFNEGDSGVCGRNWRLRETEGNTLWRVARRNNLLEAITALGRNLAIQGELIGAGIQGNNEKMKDQDFFLFNVFSIDDQKYLSPQERVDVVAALKNLGARLDCVPTLAKHTFPQNVSVEEILAMADGPSLLAPNREGVVFKREDGLFSFKAISNWYLAKHIDR